jgi:phosphoribosyl-ATP pyrophosphohydrolase
MSAPLSTVDLTGAARLKRRMTATLEKLESTIKARRGADPAASYVAALFAKGMPKIAQKLGEEAVETVIAAMAGDAKAVTGEAADLLFHLTVLLAAAGVPLSDVMAELDRREGVSGLAEKAGRSAPGES